MGRPGLVGTMARTAVVAGTATAVSGGMQRRRAAKDNEAYAEQQAGQQSDAEIAAMQAQLADLQAQQAAAAAPPPPPAGGGSDMMTELSKLADMKAAGILSDEEFAAAKAKVLG